MHRDTYLGPLMALVSLCRDQPNTPLTAMYRILAFAGLNLRYEQIQIDRSLSEHPFLLVAQMIDDAKTTIATGNAISWAEDENRSFSTGRSSQMEDMHQELFHKLWSQYDIDQYKVDRIARFERRIDINDIARLISGKRCIDFGCGHGNFAHALISRGASFVLGVDYAKGNIDHALKMRDVLGIGSEKIDFKLATVYKTGQPDASFDFAIQNGVFHHLDDEDRAYREVHRVLKPGGWFWVYTDGEGAISHDLWDASRQCLSNVPPDFIISELKHLNLSTGKRYHLGDGLNAIYRHTTWDEITGRLATLGFTSFRRIVGGFPTDFDHDAITEDAYGVEKFGSGDLRLVCQRV